MEEGGEDSIEMTDEEDGHFSFATALSLYPVDTSPWFSAKYDLRKSLIFFRNG